MDTTLVILPEGFEELETVAPVDILRRGGVDVLVASLDQDQAVRGRNGIILHADCPLDALQDQAFDLILLPGGPGVSKLRQDKRVLQRVQAHIKSGKKTLVGAICAAPLVLKDAALLDNKRYTAHFSTAKELPQALDEAVVEDGQIITSQGAGTAIAFGLALLKRMQGEAKAVEVAKAICYRT